MLRILKRAPWIAVGAAGAWLFDTTNGEERRRRLRARVEELVAPGRAPGEPAPPVDLDVEPPRSQVA